MKAAIIAVGEEVLRQEVKNTNTEYLATSLMESGFDLVQTMVVGDVEADILNALNLANSSSDLIITIGGLGPTPDDLTRETVAKFLGLDMEFVQETADKIDQLFAKRGMTTPQINYRQAYAPKGSLVLSNDFGTAPGLMISDSGKTFIILPGPPRELIPIWENEVLPRLPAKEKTFKRDFHVFGLTESETAQRTEHLMKSQTQPFVAPYASLGDIRLRVWARANSQEEFETLAKPVIDEMFEKLSPNLFENPIELELGIRLKKNNWTISTAESCTGGLISKTITDAPGSSVYLMGSAVTYSNQAKMKLLGVNPETLEKFGAVSEQTALEMAQGSAKLFGTDCAISTTGIAGPDGGTPEKPVGLVYIGILTPKGTKVFRQLFSGTRQDVRHRTLMFALTQLLLDITKE